MPPSPVFLRQPRKVPDGLIIHRSWVQKLAVVIHGQTERHFTPRQIEERHTQMQISIGHGNRVDIRGEELPSGRSPVCISGDVSKLVEPVLQMCYR